MDAVITYVDGNDPQWRRSYEECLHLPVREKRFRNWGTLKYLLRGIENCMPFIDNVHLVVSSHSQVPSWMSDKVNVVLHEDIIPGEYLPTFNSGSIELFLHRIEGLSEQFVYFNDDFFPVRPCTEETFFENGRPVIGFNRHLFALNGYKKRCRRADRCARKALGLRPGLSFIRPQHSCSPMLKSLSAELLQKAGGEIYPSISRVRTSTNFTQYVYLDYFFHSGNAVSRKLSNRHFSLAVADVERLASFIEHPDASFVCINDVDMGAEKFERYKNTIVAAFERRFPDKSRFER